MVADTTHKPSRACIPTWGPHKPGIRLPGVCVYIPVCVYVGVRIAVSSYWTIEVNVNGESPMENTTTVNRTRFGLHRSTTRHTSYEELTDGIQAGMTHGMQFCTDIQVGYTKHAAGNIAHLGTNRFAAPDVRAEVQCLACPTPFPLAVFLGVEQRFAHHLAL